MSAKKLSDVFGNQMLDYLVHLSNKKRGGEFFLTIQGSLLCLINFYTFSVHFLYTTLCGHRCKCLHKVIRNSELQISEFGMKVSFLEGTVGLLGSSTDTRQ